jgi:hypothetical protein
MLGLVTAGFAVEGGLEWFVGAVEMALVDNITGV